jgi:GNAT superfamily N-acetyltransferase
MITLDQVLADRRIRFPERPWTIVDADPWQADLRAGTLRLRSVVDADLARLHDLGRRLGERSRTMFCPYPWDEPARLDAAFAEAIARSVARVDAMYLIDDGAATVAHGFLWKAGGNPHSAAAGVVVPELGVCVADAWQGRGLGSLLVGWLQAVAARLGRDAVELTTAMENDAGWTAYRSAGFEHVGTIRTPLGVDVTAATMGQVVADHHRDERQMVWIAKPQARAAVLAYLASKRQAAAG